MEDAEDEDLIAADLERRKEKNRKRKELAKLIEHDVLSLNVNWPEFHERLNKMSVSKCCHDYRGCRSVLEEMGLSERAITACLLYFQSQGGKCDCEVNFNLDMTEPRPLADLHCADCGEDYDEYFYMLSDVVWAAAGLAEDDGCFCIGCLERRLGYKLRSGDFTDAPSNSLDEFQSLRLRDRLGRTQ
jgi:hypothetical protein